MDRFHVARLFLRGETRSIDFESVHLVFWEMENYPRSRVIFYQRIIPVNFGTTSKYVCAGKFSGKKTR